MDSSQVLAETSEAGDVRVRRLGIGYRWKQTRMWVGSAAACVMVYFWLFEPMLRRFLSGFEGICVESGGGCQYYPVSVSLHLGVGLVLYLVFVGLRWQSEEERAPMPMVVLMSALCWAFVVAMMAQVGSSRLETVVRLTIGVVIGVGLASGFVRRKSRGGWRRVVLIVLGLVPVVLIGSGMITTRSPEEVRETWLGWYRSNVWKSIDNAQIRAERWDEHVRERMVVDLGVMPGLRDIGQWQERFGGDGGFGRVMDGGVSERSKEMLAGLMDYLEVTTSKGAVVVFGIKVFNEQKVVEVAEQGILQGVYVVTDRGLVRCVVVNSWDRAAKTGMVSIWYHNPLFLYPRVALHQEFVRCSDAGGEDVYGDVDEGLYGGAFLLGGEERDVGILERTKEASLMLLEWGELLAGTLSRLGPIRAYDVAWYGDYWEITEMMYVEEIEHIEQASAYFGVIVDTFVSGRSRAAEHAEAGRIFRRGLRPARRMLREEGMEVTRYYVGRERQGWCRYQVKLAFEGRGPDLEVSERDADGMESTLRYCRVDDELWSFDEVGKVKHVWNAEGFPFHAPVSIGRHYLEKNYGWDWAWLLGEDERDGLLVLFLEQLVAGALTGVEMMNVELHPGAKYLEEGVVAAMERMVVEGPRR